MTQHQEDHPSAADFTGQAEGSPGSDQQDRINAHFDAAASYWQSVYEDPSLQGCIYRERQRAVLERLHQLGLPPGARVLEIGCGAGLLTVELARLGYAVHAVDASEAMVELTRRRLQAEELAAGFSAEVADVHALPFPVGAFSLVIAVGLLPWLHRPELALDEIARVLEDGGALILTADNRARLNTLVDPRSNLLLTPLKRLRKRLAGHQPEGATSRLHFPSHVNALLRAAGFRVEGRASVGFGPFTLWSRVLLPDSAGIDLHARLQALADRGVPLLRSTGWHYLVSARKKDPGPAASTRSPA